MSIESKHYYRFSYLRSDHWQDLRLQKLASVDAHCRKCDKRDLANDVHHLNYKHLYDVELTDLVVLCRDCHDLAHKALKDCPRIKETNLSKARWHRTLKFIKHILRQEKEAHATERRAKFHELKHSLVSWRVIPSRCYFRKPTQKEIDFVMQRKICGLQHFLELCERIGLTKFQWPCGEH